MSIEVKVPVLPESVTDATVASWHKKLGTLLPEMTTWLTWKPIKWC